MMTLGEAITAWNAKGICECWSAALLAIEESYAAILCDGDLPAGWVTARAGPWFLCLNNADVPSGGLAPYQISGRHDEAGARCLLSMGGGRLSNYSEDRFLADLYLVSIARNFRDPATPAENLEAKDGPE